MRFQRFGYSEISRTSRQPHTGRTDHNERNAGCPTHGTLLFLCLGWATIVRSTIPARIPTKLVILSAAKDPLLPLPLLLSLHSPFRPSLPNGVCCPQSLRFDRTKAKIPIPAEPFAL